MHLTSSSYKEGTNTLESTLGQFCRIKTFSSETVLVIRLDLQEKPLTVAVFSPGG